MTRGAWPFHGVSEGGESLLLALEFFKISKNTLDPILAAAAAA